MDKDATQTLATVGEDPRPAGSHPRPGLVVLFSEGIVPGTGVHAGRAQLTLGRQSDRHIYVDDPGLSRLHATFVFLEPSILVSDEGSRNGTFANGHRVERETSVRPGDVVRCGGTVLLVVPDVTAFEGWPERGLASSLVGGPAMEVVRRRIDLLARDEIEVLILGESGTGKELAARLLHDRSGRPGPFVPVNCTALPESLFEAELFGAVKGAYTGATSARPGLVQTARDGTLFLDEIGDLPLSLQPKLLRVVELREVRPLGSDRNERVHFRLVTATNRDLQLDVGAGRFRQDLFHRLCGTTVDLPPLRDRKEDIVTLARRMLAQTPRAGSRELAMTAAFVERLLLHSWPGNVRELQQCMRDAILTAAAKDEAYLKIAHLRTAVLEPAPSETPLARVREALIKAAGNVAQAAADLNMSRSKIYSLLRAHNLRPEDFR